MKLANVENGDGGYPERLRAALKQAQISRRKLSALFSEATGNQRESEYRALGKYLSGEEVPGPDRAATLALLLTEPDLARVTSVGERRARRGEGVAAELAQLRRDFEEFAQAVTVRLADLEAAQAPEARQSTRRKKA